MMQLISHDNNAGNNWIKWLKKSCFSLFWPLLPNECNGAIDKAIDITNICLDIV